MGKINFKKQPKNSQKQTITNQTLPVLASNIQPIIYHDLQLTKCGFVIEFRRRQFKRLFNDICSNISMTLHCLDTFQAIDIKVIASNLSKVFDKALKLASNKEEKITKRELRSLIINSCNDIENAMKDQLALLDLE